MPTQTVDTVRLGLRLTPEQKDEFQARLHDLLDEYAQRPDSPDGTAWSVFFAIHPDPNRP